MEMYAPFTLPRPLQPGGPPPPPAQQHYCLDEERQVTEEAALRFSGPDKVRASGPD